MCSVGTHSLYRCSKDQVVKVWMRIDPLEIPVIFVPILIFNDSLGINWHEVKQ